MMIALTIFTAVLCVLVIFSITLLQDVRDLLDILVSPFLYESDSPTFDKLDKTRKRAGKARSKEALRRK